MTATEFRMAIGALDLTQTKFAERLGVDRATVNHWARGKAPVPRYAAAYVEALTEIKRLSAKEE